MKIVRRTDDELVVRDRPWFFWLLGGGLALGGGFFLLVFAAGGLLTDWMAFAVPVSFTGIGVVMCSLARTVVCRLQRPLNELTLQRTNWWGTVTETYRLDQIARFELERRKYKPQIPPMPTAPGYRVVLVQADGARVPFTPSYTDRAVTKRQRAVDAMQAFLTRTESPQ